MIHAAGIMISCRDTGRILFLKRGPGSDFPGHWHFPGGRLETGETPSQAAERETTEEAGPCPYSAMQPWTHAIDADRTDGDTVEFTTFLAETSGEFSAKLNWENTGWAWAPANDPPLPLHPGCEAALRKMTGETISEEHAEFAEVVVWNQDHSVKLDAIVGATDGLVKRTDALLAPK